MNLYLVLDVPAEKKKKKIVSSRSNSPYTPFTTHTRARYISRAMYRDRRTIDKAIYISPTRFIVFASDVLSGDTLEGYKPSSIGKSGNVLSGLFAGPSQNDGRNFDVSPYLLFLQLISVTK